MKRVYLDTEYCYPGMVKGTPRPTSTDQRQIVQIAAIIFDTTSGHEIAQFDQVVMPIYQKELPSFFTELTGITQHDLTRYAIPFREALSTFHDFCGDIPIWTFDKDEEVLRQNCGYIELPWPFSSQFVRVKSLLPNWNIDPNAYSSGTLYKAVDLNLSGHVHNALHDVRSMANAVHIFENRS